MIKIRHLNLVLIMILSSCGAGVSDTVIELPNEWRYLKEGNKCSNAIVDDKGFIKYPWVSALKYNSDFINLEQYYSLECEKSYSDLIGNDTIFIKKRKLYTIYNINDSTLYKHVDYENYKKLFNTLKMPKELYIK